MKNNDPQFFDQIVDAVKHRPYIITEIPEKDRPNWKCYACDQANAKYEIIADPDIDGSGEPYWLGTSCIKKVMAVTGINLIREVKKL